jgi:hypothetical protein
MPLFGNHLFGSEFNAAASDSEWRAAMTLWWAAWNQVPAGSLPSDDVALCRLADLGRDVKGWRKLKDRALHGFSACSDGRLYHDFLCQQALVAWDKRIKERERKAKWRADHEAKKAGRNGDKTDLSPSLSPSQERGQDGSVPADWNGRDVTGRDNVEKKGRKRPAHFDAAAIDLPAWLETELWQRWCADRKARGKPITEEGARGQLKRLDEYRKDGTAPAAVLEHAIASGNQGLYPPPAVNGRNGHKSFREQDSEKNAASLHKLTGGLLGRRPNTAPQGEILEMDPHDRD